LKKVKKNWSWDELKRSTTTSSSSTTKTKVAKVRAEPKTIGTADVNASAMLLGWCCLSDKHSVLFEPSPCYASWFRSHFLIFSWLAHIFMYLI